MFHPDLHLAVAAAVVDGIIRIVKVDADCSGVGTAAGLSDTLVHSPSRPYF